MANVGVEYGDKKSKGVANILGKVARAEAARRELRGRAGGAA
jgi:hypothetical protein